MHSTASAAHVFHHDDPVAVATAVPTDVMPPNEGVGVDVADDAAKPEGNKKRRWHIWAWLLGLGAAVVATVAIVLIRQGHARRVARGSMDVNVPSVAPTDVGPEECRKKRVKIAEVCGLPDLDEGGTMEVKVTVNDLPYWPRTGRAESDCLEGYGRGGEDSCVVPDSSLLECFPLRNAPELPFGPGGASIEERLKVTISDVDFFWNDEIEIYAPSAEWHRPNLCEKREFQFAQPSGSATIKMVVDFGEVEDPCGVEEEALTSGLEDAADALEGVRLGLVEYVRGADPSRRRRLIFPLLASGFRLMAGAVSTGGRSFVKLFTRGSRAGNALSTVADMSEVGSLLFSIFGNDDRESSTPRYNNNEALFDEVFDRFDQIDSHLDGIQAQIKDGFEEIKLVIEEEFAQQELDDWITFRLNINLRGDYQGYMDRSHSPQSRARYEEKFRDTCNGDYSPYNIFQVLYSYSCLECQRLSGKAKNYFLDTYVNLARANFDTPTNRVLWFRRSFGTVIVGALTESIYLYSVCLYRSKDECEVVDPVWDARLREMGDALEEVITSLGEAETRLE